MGRIPGVLVWVPDSKTSTDPGSQGFSKRPYSRALFRGSHSFIDPLGHWCHDRFQSAMAPEPSAGMPASCLAVPPLSSTSGRPALPDTRLYSRHWLVLIRSVWRALLCRASPWVRGAHVVMRITWGSCAFGGADKGM